MKILSKKDSTEHYTSLKKVSHATGTCIPVNNFPIFAAYAVGCIIPYC